MAFDGEEPVGCGGVRFLPRAMYARLGYREVPAFNDAPYVDHWFEKRLAE